MLNFLQNINELVKVAVFTLKDHLIGVWAMFSGNSKLQLRMRIKYLEAKGFGNSPMAHVLRHELAMLEFEK